MASKETSVKKQVSYNGVDYDVVREGLAEILNPTRAQAVSEGQKGDHVKAEAQSVFYNPIQQFNRDLSVLAIRVFAEQLVTIRSQKQGKRKNRQDGPRKRRKIEQVNGKEEVKEESDSLAKHHDVTAEELLLLEAEMDADHPMGESKDQQEASNSTNGPNKPIANGTAHATEAGQIPSQSQRPTIRILDALSATGLRALRYAQEVTSVTHVVANDLSATATKAIDVNVKHNKQDDKITLNTGDALEYMYKSRNKFEVVDLDPYGTAGPFLDAAVQALTSGGLLCVTCTDSSVFASTGYCEKTFALYGGLPVKGAHSHEGGLRLLLHAIATSAARYGLAIEPLLSLSIDYYIRVFVKIRKSPQEVKFLAGKTMAVYACDSGCGAWTTQPLARIKPSTAKNGAPYHTFSLAQAPTTNSNCSHCGFVTHLHGPMWGGPMHNPYFVQSMLDTLETLPEEDYGTKPRMEGMLITAREEVLLSIPSSTEPSPEARIPPQLIDRYPFFFLPSVISGVLHCVAPSAAHIRGALLRLGYKVTRSHAKPGSIKTDAPWTVIWEVMREWIRQEKPIKEETIKPGSSGATILAARREKRDSLSNIRDEMQSVGRDNSMDKSTMKTRLESMLFRLSNDNADISNVDGEEADGAVALEKNIPLHKLKIVFDEQLGKKSEESQGKKLVRYQINPRPHWGPMSRAKGAALSDVTDKTDAVGL